MKVLNDILGYKDLKLYQDPDYFCFSLDSVVLANYCKIRKRDTKIVEFCSCNGKIGAVVGNNGYEVNSLIQKYDNNGYLEWTKTFDRNSKKTI